jgi:GntR family transcriptional regulator
MAVELRLEQASEVPLYVQIKNQLRLLVDRKAIKPGEQLPTVRELALSLNVNANTISRVYTDLEREGYLSRRRGIGTFAVDRHETEPQDPPGRGRLVETLRQLRALGYSARQILEMTAEILGE